MERQTTTEKYIKKAIKEAKEELAGTSITNCVFNGAKYDERFIETVSDIASAIETNAEACLETAKALVNITNVFRTSNVNIDAMIKIGAKE